tara:strand:- start:637 stop:906 length:270 start_codon:yes stop_codon:yes gene_type:complete
MIFAQAVDPSLLSNGNVQEVLAVIVAMLFAALAWVVRTYLVDRTRLEKRNSELLSLHAQKLEELHGRTLEIALKTQKAILKLGEPNEEA